MHVFVPGVRSSVVRLAPTVHGPGDYGFIPMLVAAARKHGLVQRVKQITAEPVDLVLDTAPVGGALPALIELAGGDPQRVLTISDVQAAQELGARDTFHEPPSLIGHRFAAFNEFAELAAEGRFSVPIARTFPLGEWRTAMEISLTGHARGRLLLRP